MIVMAFMIGLISSNVHHVYFYYAQTMQEQSYALLKYSYRIFRLQNSKITILVFTLLNSC